MSTKIVLVIVISSLLELAVGHADHSTHHHSHESVPMTSRSHLSERHHIGDHLGDVVGDMDNLSPEELRFLYFKMHDSDGDERLDGKELVNSLLHFHVEESSAKIFASDELANMIDPILRSDDSNCDGFIDYREFVAAQKVRGF